MKQIIGNYSFNATSKTVTLTDFGTVRLDRLLLIVNVTTGQVLYTFNDATLKATVATNVITLNSGLSTTGMANGDKLEVFYDCLTGDPTYDTQPVSAASLPLPSGAATSAAQSTGNTALSSIDTKTPALSGGRVPVDNSGVTQPVAGDIAAAATDSGNPVKVGGKYNTTQPTYSDGQRGQLEIDSRGQLKVTLMSTSAAAINLANLADNVDASAVSSSFNKFATQNRETRFNGTSWDRVRGNEEATLLASASRTTTQTGADITNYNGLASLIVVLDVTTPGTGSVTVTIEGKDSASGKYYTLLAGSAVTTTSTNRYRVGPLLAAAANSIAQDYLPRVFRITVTANNANAMTYSVGYAIVRD